MLDMPTERIEDPREISVRPTASVRDRAIERLSAAFAEGALETEELERRISVVHHSGSVAELDALLADLPPPTAMVPATVPPATMVPATAAPERTVSVLGSTRRAGRWVVPQRLMVRAVFGNVELDFRDAVLPTGVVELDLRAVFGNIEITVPPQLTVESNGSAVLGNFDHVERSPSQAAGDGPVLRITGTTVFGNVEITTREPARDDLPKLPPRR